MAAANRHCKSFSPKSRRGCLLPSPSASRLGPRSRSRFGRRGEADPPPLGAPGLREKQECTVKTLLSMQTAASRPKRYFRSAKPRLGVSGP